MMEDINTNIPTPNYYKKLIINDIFFDLYKKSPLVLGLFELIPTDRLFEYVTRMIRTDYSIREFLLKEEYNSVNGFTLSSKFNNEKLAVVISFIYQISIDEAEIEVNKYNQSMCDNEILDNDYILE